MRRIVLVTAVLAATCVAPAYSSAARDDCAQGEHCPKKSKPKRHRAPKGHRADGNLKDWRGTPTYIAGQSITSRGEFIYTDYLFDDYGPDLNGHIDQPAFRSALAPTRGDYRYPKDDPRYANNGADLREFRIAADKKTVHLLIGLETMTRKDAAVAMIAFDTDHSDHSSMLGGNWPDGAGIHTPGPETFVTTWGTGSRLTSALPNGKNWKLRTAVNLAENTIEVDIPRKALGPAAPTSRVWVVTGLNDGHGKFAQQTQGATAVFDTAFQTQHYTRFTGGGWNDDDQATRLATGDISGFDGSFSMSRLLAGKSDPRPPIQPGRYTRIFRSAKNYGEGIALKDPTAGGSIGGDQTPEFKSPWQEYALYIPKGYDPRHPNVFTLDGHSLDSSYLEYFTVAPNQQVQLGDQRRSIIITPLSRGTDTWYIDSGLIDTIEAWNDARRHYPIDDNRTFITGYSMGGYMTYRLGLLMPDRFSKASVYVGPPIYQLWPYPLPPVPADHFTAIGNTNEIVDNAHDLPYEINHGNADELVPVAGVQRQVDTFQAAGNAYVFYRHSANDHLAFILNDEWSHTRDFLGTAPRVKNPIEVVYKRYPAMDLPQDGLRFDSAYWVSGIGVRGSQTDTSNFGEVRATTFGFGGHRTKPQQELPVPVSGPVSPGIKFEQRQVAGAAIVKRNGFEATLTKLDHITFDVGRMGLSAGGPISIHVVSDGVSTLNLLGRFPSSASAAGGAVSHRIAGGLAVTVPGGTHDVTVTP
ncbi:MAG: hypothetical protein E6G53_06260 [Actinobacteria bacterium]|nr:MAG: hypothetical protein E6G53_06260 [Actinomycetota bacterium]